MANTYTQMFVQIVLADRGKANGMRDHEEISPLRGLVTIGLNSRLIG